MASFRGILNIQSLNEFTPRNGVYRKLKRAYRHPVDHAVDSGSGRGRDFDLPRHSHYSGVIPGDGTFPILFGYISYRIRIVLYLNVS